MAWPWLANWFRRRSVTLDHLRITLYTREGCHLCDAAWDLLQRQRRRYGFHLSHIDIDRDPQLATLYEESVPVVTVNGKVRFRGPIDKVLLDRLLFAEARAARQRRG